MITQADIKLELNSPMRSWQYVIGEREINAILAGYVSDSAAATYDILTRELEEQRWVAYGITWLVSPDHTGLESYAWHQRHIEVHENFPDEVSYWAEIAPYNSYVPWYALCGRVLYTGLVDGGIEQITDHSELETRTFCHVASLILKNDIAIALKQT